ncbi:MAG: hypothetical protein KIT09_33315 [Bryobacteraceae bacterium]|nr:hypothetical protein [Bryobacteraceae bacterium]
MTDNAGEAGPRGQCFCMGTGPELFALLKKLGPDTARQHFRNARIEMLKGFRAIIDRRIEQLSRPEDKKGATIVVE